LKGVRNQVDSGNWKSIEFAQIEPVWRFELWPNRASQIEPISWIGIEGHIDPRRADDFSLFWGAESEGKLQAVVSLQVPMSGLGRVRGLWVHPSRRSAGLGTQAIELVAGEAIRRNLEGVWTLARQESRAFYARVGFSPVKKIEGYEFGPHHLMTRKR